MGTVTLGKGKPSLRKQEVIQVAEDTPIREIIKEVIVEKIVEIKVPEYIEVKVPDYITVIREEKIEVPVFHEVIREVEKIVEVPRIQVVEKPVEIIKEVYDISKLIQEKVAHKRTKTKLRFAYVAIAVMLIISMVR